MLLSLQFTVPQLQDILTSLRMRRDLDMPAPVPVRAALTGGATAARRKRKLIDFRTNSFQKWSGPIPYMFDGQHSEYPNTRGHV